MNWEYELQDMKIYWKKKVERKVIIYGTYCQEIMDIDVAEFISGEPIIYEVLIKKSVRALKSLSSNEKRHCSSLW